MSRTIHDELRLVASVGVAPNKFLAKIASDVEKPDGFVVVETGKVRTFLDPLPVGRIWGVGKVAGQVFDRLGIRTIGQLRELSVEALKRDFGSSGSITGSWPTASTIAASCRIARRSRSPTRRPFPSTSPTSRSSARASSSLSSKSLDGCAAMGFGDVLSN